MKTLLISVLALSLQGCWFIYIPGSLISQVGDSIGGYEGRHCVSGSAKVGDRLPLTSSGSWGTVTKLEGTSGRCTDQKRPIRALIASD